MARQLKETNRPNAHHLLSLDKTPRPNHKSRYRPSSRIHFKTKRRIGTPKRISVLFQRLCATLYQVLPLVNGIKTPSRYIPRERVLSDNEVKAIWYACDPQDVYGATIRLLFLCGQRLTQTSLMCLEWIEGDTITFPAWACKNNRIQKLPLPKSAIPLIKVLRPFKNWQKRKPSLNKSSGVQNWCHHDARRYFAVSQQRIGTRLEVTENLLGHCESRAGVIGIYQRHDFWPEMQEAVDKYEQFLIGLFALLRRPEPRASRCPLKRSTEMLDDRLLLS